MTNVPPDRDVLADTIREALDTYWGGNAHPDPRFEAVTVANAVRNHLTSGPVVEQVAMAAFTAFGWDVATPMPWDDAPEDFRITFRKVARAAIEAAV